MGKSWDFTMGIVSECGCYSLNTISEINFIFRNTKILILGI
jgi:hypothetical protein